MIDHKEILNKIVLDYTQILRSNLVGIYLHSSVAMGCATESSDIDFLVVVENPLTNNACRKLIDVISQLKNLPKRVQR